MPKVSTYCNGCNIAQFKQGPFWSPDGRQIAHKDSLQPAGAPARDELWLLTARKSGGETIAGTNPHRLVIDERGAVQGSPPWGNR
jgi:hypothetical protein